MNNYIEAMNKERKWLGRLLLCMSALLACSGNVYASVIDTVTFVDNNVPTATFKTPTAASRSRRPMVGRGGFVNVEVAAWPSEKSLSWQSMVETSIKLACDLWANYLEYGDSIKLLLRFDSAQTDDIKTTVFYTNSDGSDICYPYSLQRKLYPSDVDSSIQYDAEVAVNPNATWHLGMGDANGGKNLTLAVMRSISAAMGFGSSFRIDSRNRIVRKCIAYVIFDHYVRNALGEYLKDIPLSSGNATSQAISDFVQSRRGSLCFDTGSATYSLYAPDPFENDKSLRYIDVPNSLMSVAMPDSIDLEVDPATIDILETLGWNLTTTASLEIVCEDADSTGTASAYQPHRCYLSSTNLQFSSQEWTCLFPDTNGIYQTVATSDSAEIYTPIIADANQYDITADGEVKAIILFEGTAGSEHYQAKRQVWLQLKPQISYISAPVFTPSVMTEGDYSVDLDVKYEGCYYLYVTVRPQYAPYQTIYYSESPYFTHFHFDDVDFWGNVRITFTGVNAYGNTTRTIVLNAPAGSRRSADHPSIVAEKSSLYPELAATDTLRVHDVCTFCLSDGLKADWQLMMEGRESWMVVREANDSEELTVAFEKGLTDFFALESMYDRLGRRICSGRVYAVRGDRRDSMDVVFQLSPDRPIIKDVQLLYDYFDYDQAEFINTSIRVSMVLSPDTKGISCLQSYMDQEGHTHAFGSYHSALDSESNTWTSPSYVHWDFDHFFDLCASGEFHQSAPVRIYVNEYIDPYYIDLFRQWETTLDIADVSGADGIEVKVRCPGEIEVISPRAPVMSVSLVDMCGRTIARSSRSGILSYPPSFKGAAVIVVQTKEGVCNLKRRLP
ncbi:MAG: hypothetical protein IJ176_01705 [Prevotella sp.]|nr:hypothetical protein [Prevotella sp.]